ncbi:hypothetical protein RHRU231_230094 [Rhodococcus ruber]|uniref:Uncharacterized protein n=1 Tax=Rhodococcus ruber TaxID=1830 RepID=A0A098BHR2_9NOCA|nr:hypothetical protein RHRU231_230094 [Rhodococcus ruber]
MCSSPMSARGTWRSRVRRPSPRPVRPHGSEPPTRPGNLLRALFNGRAGGAGAAAPPDPSPRLVLGDAVDAAPAAEERPGVHSHDAPARIRGRQDLRGLVVGGVAEAAGDHPAVDHVVVDVAVVHPALVVAHRGRGRHPDDAPRLAADVGRVLQPVDDLGGDVEVRVAPVALVVDEDHTRGRDRGDDVDVPAGAVAFLVPRQPARQPDRAGRAEGAPQFRFDRGLVQVRVAPGVELDGLGEQDGAETVDLDAAALVDQHRGDALDAGALEHERRDPGVVVPAGPVLGAPPVEHPVDPAAAAVVVEDEGRPDVAHPGVVQRGLDQFDVAGQVSARRVDLAGIGHHRDGFELGDGMRDRGPRGAGLVALLRGVAQRVSLGGEGHPRALVRFALRGHAPAHRVAPKGACASTGAVSEP